jgi:hypothetical protein
VQVDHLHLLVEAVDKQALSTGMRGLAIKIARRINRLVGRRGRIWADRWHGHELRYPREVRAAIGYVLCNFRKHHPNERAMFDRFSSAAYFTGFRELGGRSLFDRDASALALRTQAAPMAAPVEQARTWLLRVGWLRHGPLSLLEVPGRGT